MAVSEKRKAGPLDSIRVLVWEREEESTTLKTYHLAFFVEDPGETFIEVPPEERQTIRLRLSLCDREGVPSRVEAVAKVSRMRDQIEIPDSGVHLDVPPEEWDGQTPFTLIVPNWLRVPVTVSEEGLDPPIEDWRDDSFGPGDRSRGEISDMGEEE